MSLKLSQNTKIHPNQNGKGGFYFVKPSISFMVELHSEGSKMFLIFQNLLLSHNGIRHLQ